MFRPHPPETAPPLVRFIPLFFANCIPLVGVIWLHWEADILILLYIVELLFLLLLAGVKSLFAAHPPKETESDLATVSNATLSDTRGSVTVVSWLPPIYPRNVPYAFGITRRILWLALVLTIMLSTVIEPLQVLQQPVFLAAVVALVSGHLAETVTQYFGHAEYEQLSPYGVLEPPARQGFLLVMLLLVLGALLETGIGSIVALSILVSVKILSDWAVYHVDQSTSVSRFTRWLAGPGERDTADSCATQVPVPSEEPTARIQADQRTVLLSSVFRSIPKSLQKQLPLAGMAWLVLLITVGEAFSALQFQLITLGLILGAFIFGTIIEAGGWYVRYGGLEYQRRGDRVVAYDRFFEMPQWSTPLNEIRNVEVASGRLADRFTDAQTFSMTSGWDDNDADRIIGPTADPDTAIEKFSLPVVTTAVAPIRRGPAVIALCVPLLALIGTLWAISRPSPSLQALLFFFFVFPVVILISQGIWKRAYS